MKYYPVFLDIAGKKCLVIGGGEVAFRKVRRLLDCGAIVFVVSPEINAELASLQQQNRVNHIADKYNSRYLEGANLVIGATDNEEINAAISRDAREKNIPVNIVDDPQKCDFILPAIVERGDLTMAIGTAGKSPALARHLREELEDKYGEEYGVLINILGNLRPQMKEENSAKERLEALLAAGILDLIKDKKWIEVKNTVREITGREAAID